MYWATDCADPATFADAASAFRELVARDANRAGVAIWRLGNVDGDTDARLAILAGLAAAAREADPSRPVAAACLVVRENLRFDDRLAGHLDVVGLGKYFLS